LMVVGVAALAPSTMIPAKTVADRRAINATEAEALREM
jgi:hypothetical protein